MTTIYQPFINKIAKTIGGTTVAELQLNDDMSIRGQFLKAENRNFSNFSGGARISGITDEAVGLEKLAMLLGMPLKTPTLGNHPDFTHIAQTGKTEYHYATSVFQDVKGSTSFFKKYTNEQVFDIIQTIAVATTHTHGLFTGHIQRLQYDGVFSYFANKGVAEKLSTFYSLCATAFSTYFVKYELRETFKEGGFDKIYTKTGIDYGAKDKVMWVLFGVPGCSEVSTNSLHTSLTFKIQDRTGSDKICVGDNVAKLLPELSTYFTLQRATDGNIEEVYNDGKGFAYKYHDFHWENFLSEIFADFVKKDRQGKIYIDYGVNSTEAARIAKLRWNTIQTKLGLAAIDNKGTLRQASVQDTKEVKVPNSGFYYGTSL